MFQICELGMEIALKVDVNYDFSDFDELYSADPFEDAAAVQRINRISGYIELGMPKEALWEIEALEAEEKNLPSVKHFQLMALIAMRKFRLAATLARNAIAEFPEVSEFYIHAGAALAALKKGSEARRVWNSAPSTLQHSGMFQLNVAFCEVELGDLFRARQCLKEAMKIDPGVIPLVKDEPRLLGLLASESASPPEA